VLYVFTKNKHDQGDRIKNLFGMNMTVIMSYRTSPRSCLFKTIILQQNTITKSEVRDV